MKRRILKRNQTKFALLLCCCTGIIAGCRGGSGTPSGTQPDVGTLPQKSQNVSVNSVRFSDQTAAAGLDFIQSDGSCGMRYFVEQVVAGAAIIDVNQDGFPDIYFPQPHGLGVCSTKVPPAHHRLYLNNGKGQFRLLPNAFGKSEPNYGIAASVGDYNNDGYADLYVAGYDGNKLYRNRGNNTFEDVTPQAGVATGGFSTGSVWFDYDGDGKLDLYVLRYCEWQVDTDIVCPGPDGKRDACNPTTYTPARNVLYHNNGNGTFTDVTKKSGTAQEQRRSLSAVAADFNVDGKLDLFVANDIGPNSLFQNNGDGTFEDVAMQRSVALGVTGSNQANMGSKVADFDEDGDLDIVVTTFANEPYTLYRNDGDFYTDASVETGIAAPTLPFLGFGVTFVDTSNSGRLDVFFANGHISPFSGLSNGSTTYKQRNQLLLKTEQNTYVETLVALPKDDVRVHRGTCVTDYDNDGRQDILVTATNDRPTLLHNETPQANWLTLRLIDKNGCVTPIGTVCVATIGKKRLLRGVFGGGGYGGESDYRLHIGLGNADKADELKIRWMSGKTQILKNVKANQVLTLRESSRI